MLQPNAKVHPPLTTVCTVRLILNNVRILDIPQTFYTYRIAVTADAEKAFLMILVSEKDQDALGR